MRAFGTDRSEPEKQSIVFEPVHTEQGTSPLTSDAETEPLPFDDTDEKKMNDEEVNDIGKAPPHNEPAERASALSSPSGNFGGDSDLTDESEHTTPQPEERIMAYQTHFAHAGANTGVPNNGDDDGDDSSLSEEGDQTITQGSEAELEKSAIDGLAELAASNHDAGNELEEGEKERPASSTLTPGTLQNETANDAEDEGQGQLGDDDAEVSTQASEQDYGESGVSYTLPHRKETPLHRAAIAGKRRAAATGGAPSLLMEQDVDSSNPASAATSRQASPIGGIDTDPKTKDEDVDMDMDMDEAQPEEAAVEEQDGFEAEFKENREQEHEKYTEEKSDEDALGAEDAGHDGEDEAEGEGEGEGDAAAEQSAQADVDDEASDHRQEALEQLTRIELGFVMLRQRLYVERLEELERESDMIQQGTHPEIQMLHTLIDARKEKRLGYLQEWLRNNQREHELRASAEEKIAWVNWRDQAATIRHRMMCEMDRKRRRLEREKRMLDAPQPTRRYQPFETEFAHKPPSYSRRTRHMPDQYMAEGMSLRDTRSFVAYPDVRGLEDYDVWMDLEQMGIRPMPMPPMGYLRPEELPSHEMYAAPMDMQPHPGPPPHEMDAPMQGPHGHHHPVHGAPQFGPPNVMPPPPPHIAPAPPGRPYVSEQPPMGIPMSHIVHA